MVVVMMMMMMIESKMMRFENECVRGCRFKFTRE